MYNRTLINLIMAYFIRTVLWMYLVTVNFIPDVIAQSSCTTPNGNAGTCKSVLECTTLSAIVYKKNKTIEELNFLRNSSCGFLGKIPKVCCPLEYKTECSTADGVKGLCIDIFNCTVIMSMLQNAWLTTEDQTYVTRSRCQGSANYSVCCPPAPPAKPVQSLPPLQSPESLPPLPSLPSSQPAQPEDFPARSDFCAATALPPDPQKECCGVDVSSDRILGGNATGIDQYTWLALIEYHIAESIVTGCGGSLISGRYVLTAAHCSVVDSQFTPVSVRLGEYDTRSSGPDCVELGDGVRDCTDGEISVPIERAISHPSYQNMMPRWHDIALLRLARMVTFSDFIKPICLPSVNIATNPPEDLRLIAAGWGATNSNNSDSYLKQEVTLPYVNLTICMSKYKNRFQLGTGQMCAGGEHGRDSCTGDSGGPLMRFTEGRYEVTGIISFGTIPCGLRYPGIYTNVAAHLDWIRKNMNE